MTPSPARRPLAPAAAVAAVLASLLLALGLLSAPGAAAQSQIQAQYSAPLTTAIAELAGAGEVRTGYNRDLFPHWIDADGDGCDTRREVLLAEARTQPTVGSGCSLTGGSWYSYYDGATQTSATALDIDHMVPLAEAWDSGARSWTAAERRAFANDLGDGRSLVAVTSSVNRAKSDGDIADWLPARDRCRYLREFVAVKVRWRLSVDTRERSAMNSLAGNCTNSTITVTRAR